MSHLDLFEHQENNQFCPFVLTERAPRWNVSLKSNNFSCRLQEKASKLCKKAKTEYPAFFSSDVSLSPDIHTSLRRSELQGGFLSSSGPACRWASRRARVCVEVTDSPQVNLTSCHQGWWEETRTVLRDNGPRHDASHMQITWTTSFNSHILLNFTLR